MRWTLCLALILAGAGCAVDGEPRQSVSSESMSRIRPGVSREAEVRELLGPPMQIQSFPRQERLVWSYAAPGVQPTLFVVQFSKDGIVREAFTIDDPDSLGAE